MAQQQQQQHLQHQQQQQQQQLQQHHHSNLLLQQQQQQQLLLQQEQQLQQYDNNLYSHNYNMEEYERRRRREREKHERQQGIQSDDRETSLFGEPRRLTEGDAEITAALGEFIDARNYINQSTVGISRHAPGGGSNPRLQAPTLQQLTAISNSISSSSSTSASAASLLPPGQTQTQQQHYQQQQRPTTYLKQADNKPPYNGRGGYPGQPMKNDIPSSSGMAPPRGPPKSNSITNNASSTPLGPPISTQVPNGREKSFLGPPTAALQNGGGRFAQPMPSKRPGGGLQQPPPQEKDVRSIISEMTNNYLVTPLNPIAATPQAPTRENYNLNAPNKFKYAFDIGDPIMPLGSPPSAQASTLITPIAPMTSPIASLLTTSPKASQLPQGSGSGSISAALSTTTATVVAPVAPIQQLPPTPPKAMSVTPPPAAKPLKLEKQDSCLENDLELSESEDERKKDGRSPGSSSNGSESDSGESGSETSSKGGDHHQHQQQQQHPHHPHHHHHQPQQQQQQFHQQHHQQQRQQLTANGGKKKYSQTIIASGANTITGLLTSSGLGSSGGGNVSVGGGGVIGSGGSSGGSTMNSSGLVGGSNGGGGGSGSSSGIGTMSSGSSSNKTPSPTESSKWNLSRFFPKPTSQTSSESVSPGNLSMKVPGILPGGAQIIAEPIDDTRAIVKNEKIHDDHLMDMDECDEDDDEDDHHHHHHHQQQQQQKQLRYGAGLSVTPVAVKKEEDLGLTAIPKSQIKRENESQISSRLSELSATSGSSSSSSSSSDSASASEVVPPMPGPGETLQIPGVPAAITSVMRVPPVINMQKSQSISVTVTPIAPLPASPKPRQKKPRKKKMMSAPTAPLLDSSDEDEPSKRSLVMVASATQVSATAAVPPPTKKGRGRPRKQQQSGGSGNLSSASAGSSSQAKGPTLTAAKKPLVKGPATSNAVIPISSRKREHSSQSSSNGNTPTKKMASIPPVVVPIVVPPPPITAAALLPRNPASSSSSDEESSSSTCSTSKSSSSSSSSDETETQKTNCRIVKLNKPGPVIVVPPAKRQSSYHRRSGGSSSPTSSSSDLDKPNLNSHNNVGGITDSSSSNNMNNNNILQQQSVPQQSPYKVLVSGGSQQLSSSDSSSSSGSSTSGDEDDAKREKDREKKRKSDKNKISTLTRIFNPKEGGAKKQGQVVIIDQSEEQLQQQQQQQMQQIRDRFPPPQMGIKPRMTPTHVQQQLGAGLASPARTTTPHLTSLICKIDLSKLSRERILRLKKLAPSSNQQNGHLTPNGHIQDGSSPAGLSMPGAKVKHEHQHHHHHHPVKPEPELDSVYEPKFKPNNVKQEFQLKQERDRERDRNRERDQQQQQPPRRRKRSSSSSSSPYKEKKRKKEKPDPMLTAKDQMLQINPVLLPSNNHERLSYDKLQLLQEDAAAAAAAAAVVATSNGQKLFSTGTASATVVPLCSVMAPSTCNEAVQTTPPTTVTTATITPAPPPPTRLIYRSYFDRDEEQPTDDHRKNKRFLQEAINRKHAADLERDSFNQVTLYLEAVAYFLLAAEAMERCSSETATWTMYKDTLSLIKFISSKFRPYQQSSNCQQETHNKVAILSLRCQSLISLKLYKLRRVNCRTIIASLTDFFRNGRGDIVNGNTPSSISPSNSVGSQGSGSNTPPGKIVPQDIHNQLCKQNEYLTYVNSAHELWDQADRLVRNGNHTDFFRELDHGNGPLTLHSTMPEVFRYVQAGLKTLRDAVSHPAHQL